MSLFINNTCTMYNCTVCQEICSDVVKVFFQKKSYANCALLDQGNLQTLILSDHRISHNSTSLRRATRSHKYRSDFRELCSIALIIAAPQLFENCPLYHSKGKDPSITITGRNEDLESYSNLNFKRYLWEGVF